jgi:hypothetical protein
MPDSSGPDAAAHIKALQALCEQAEKLRLAAEELCARLTVQIERTGQAVHPQQASVVERRRKLRRQR